MGGRLWRRTPTSQPARFGPIYYESFHITSYYIITSYPLGPTGSHARNDRSTKVSRYLVSVIGSARCPPRITAVNSFLSLYMTEYFTPKHGPSIHSRSRRRRERKHATPPLRCPLAGKSTARSTADPISSTAQRAPCSGRGQRLLLRCPTAGKSSERRMAARASSTAY